MNPRQVAETGAARNAARAAFNEQIDQIRSDIEAKSLGGRIADRVGDDARQAIDQALEVAGESKWVIAGTAGALLLWCLRNPLIGWIATLIPGDETAETEELNDE
jgi:hypothetical protein